MSHNREKTAIAMKKAESLIKKIIKMINENRYCIDVIQQNLAVIGLLKSVNLLLLKGHLENCVKNAIQEKDENKLNIMMDELLKVVNIAQYK